MTTVSVIMSALNEPYLKQTVESVLESSGDALTEIIVVDDCSDEPVVLDTPKTRVIRNESRQGLIRARQIATENSKSDIVVSVDAHVKVADDWLTPIINKIEHNPKCIAIPMTKNLNPGLWQENLDRLGSKTHWKWNLDFAWRFDDGTDTSPAFAGHCFAFSRDWWEQIGGFDSHMNKWGGENIEMSLKSWLCGGSVELVRDTWTAHWFKPKWTYQMDHASLLHNKTRIAEVWFDDYKSRFYQAIKKQPGSVDFGDISKQLAIKEKMQCRDIKWFCDTLQPESGAIYDLRSKHFGSRIAVLGASASYDQIDHEMLRRHDIVIGVNYISKYFKCDYVVFHDYKPAYDVLNSGLYAPSQLLVPLRLQDGRKLIPVDTSVGWTVYEMGPQDKAISLKDKDPPFFHHATSVHTAAHIAAFMGAKSVTMAACDGVITGKSHASIPEYKGGWGKSEQAQNYLSRIARGHDMLREAFHKWQIPLLKYGYL